MTQMASLRVLDQASDAAQPVNEDLVGIASGAVWILDGATGVGARALPSQPSDAAWFVATLSQGMQRHLEPAAPTRTALGAAIADVAAAYHALRPAAAAESPAASLALLRRDEEGIELTSLGDCKSLVRTPDGATTAFGHSPVTSFDAAVVDRLKELRAAGLRSRAEAWPHLMAMIRANRRLRNRPEGYWVLDETQAPLAHLQRRKIAAPCTVMLITDGFYRLVDTLHRYDEAGLIAAASSGLGKLIEELRELERSDPECLVFPRIKPHDDASAVLVEVGP